MVFARYFILPSLLATAIAVGVSGSHSSVVTGDSGKQNFHEDLPEVVVRSNDRGVLHILAYVREFSQLTSYTDTVDMFREKMVDFMLPNSRKVKFKGWHFARILKSKSYYHFTDDYGLDSVSDKCRHSFSWSDWVGIPPVQNIPMNLLTADNAVDTILGKNGKAEIWAKSGDSIKLDINVLADTLCRKWVPNIQNFFRNGKTEFERFQLSLNYSNVFGGELKPLDIDAYTFNIESKGRGHSLFRFNRHDQPFYVATHAEVYILDKEFISQKEAHKWDKLQFNPDDVEIISPVGVPGLPESTQALIARVETLDASQERLMAAPDYKLLKPDMKISFGNRVFRQLKRLLGLTK